MLTGNNEKAPFNDAKFREAISYAMNKQEMSLKATYGVMKPASQTGLKLPSMADAAAGQVRRRGHRPARTTSPRPNQLLDAAGYKKGADGKRTNPDGSPLAVNFSVQAGFIDYQAIADVVVKGLNDARRHRPRSPPPHPDSVDGQKKTGDFQLMLEYLHGGCELAKNLGAKLSSTQIPTQDRRPAQRRALQGPGRRRGRHEAGSATPTSESQKRDLGAARRHDDDEVPGHRRSSTLRPASSTAPTRPSAGRASRTRTPTRRTTSS